MIIASVVTVPGRMHLLSEALDELLLSTILPDFLYVSISRYYPRLGVGFSDRDYKSLTNKLNSYPIPSKIIIYEKDIGPCAKLYTPLKHHENISKDDFILIFDDDTGLFPKAIETLVNCAHCSGRNSSYGFIGFNFDTNWYLHGEYINGGDYLPLRFLGGYRGCLYPVQSLNIEDFLGFLDWIISYFDNLGKIPLHDDHIFSSYFLDRGLNLRLANIKEKLPPGELYYKSKNTFNGIMQTDYWKDNLYILKDLLTKSNVDTRAF